MKLDPYNKMTCTFNTFWFGHVALKRPNTSWYSLFVGWRLNFWFRSLGAMVSQCCGILSVAIGEKHVFFQMVVESAPLVLVQLLDKSLFNLTLNNNVK